jgi:predicted regulator of Ras-like GTPase activity (Roadblock/LC7/MglB family)
MSDLRPLSGEPVSRSGRLDRVVADLLSQAPEIEAAAVVSFDGLPMVSALPAGMNEDRVAAMSAALLSLGERAAEGLGRGELSQVYIEGESGTVYLVSCDNEAVLVAVAAAGAKAGLMLYEVRRAAISVANVLREDDAAEAMAAHAAQAQQHVHDVMAQHQQPAAPLLHQPAQPQPTQHQPTQPPLAPASMPSYAPVGAPEGNGNGNGQGGNGWTSYAPGSPLPGEPTPWS